MSARTIAARLLLSVLALAAAAPPAAAQNAFPHRDPSAGSDQWTGPDARLGSDTRLLLAVESTASNATGALAANRLDTERVRHALAGLRVPGTIIQPGETFMEVDYERQGPIAPRAGLWVQEPRVVGYRAVTVLVVHTSAPQRLGLLIDTAIGAGANRLLDVQGGRSDAWRRP